MSRKRAGYRHKLLLKPTKVSIVARFNPETEHHNTFETETVMVTPIEVEDEITKVKRWETSTESLNRIVRLAEARIEQLNAEYNCTTGFYILKKGRKTSRRVKNN